MKKMFIAAAMTIVVVSENKDCVDVKPHIQLVAKNC